MSSRSCSSRFVLNKVNSSSSGGSNVYCILQWLHMLNAVLDWSSRSVPDLSWDPAIVNSGDVSATDGKFSQCHFSHC